MTSRRKYIHATLAVVVIAVSIASGWALATQKYATFAMLLALTLLPVGTLIRPRVLIERNGPDEREGAHRYSQVLLKYKELRQIVDQVPNILLSYDGNKVIALNRSARLFFRTDEVLSDSAFLALLKSTDAGRNQSVSLTIGDTRRSFMCDVAEVSGPNRMFRLISLTDIGSSLNAEEERVVTRTMRVISHEILNGLAPIISLSETLRDLLEPWDVNSGEKATKVVSMLVSRSNALMAFTEGYRSLMDLPPPSLRIVDLDPLMSDLVQMFEAHWSPGDVAINGIRSGGPIIARIDPDQIVQALWALLQNAAEANLAAGKGPSTVSLAMRSDGSVLKLVVTDSGSGFGDLNPSEAIQPFVTGKPGGSGIGLSLAQRVARTHGGDLLVVSSSAGSAIEIRIPNGERPL